MWSSGNVKYSLNIPVAFTGGTKCDAELICKTSVPVNVIQNRRFIYQFCIVFNDTDDKVLTIFGNKCIENMN